MSEKSLKNLELSPQIKPGEVLNPNGSRNRRRPYTDRYELTATSITPEPVRIILNMKLRMQLLQILEVGKAKELLSPAMQKQLEQEIKKELIPKGVIWAEAQSIRLHLAAVLEGDVSAATEVRESVEGRSTQRIEVHDTNDRLEQLLDEFKFARTNPPKPPGPASDR